MDDRGPRLLASCWTLVALSAIFLGLRLYCKLWRARGLWWDDHLMIIAWVALSTAVSINTYITSIGFGRHIWTISDEDKRTINLCTILVAAFGITATTTSKTSFAITLYRIILNAWLKRFLIFVIVSVNLSMHLIWIFGFAKCTPTAKVFDGTVPGTCWDRSALLKYQLFAAYYSSLLDFVLAVLPWKVLMGMVMLRREKIGVIVAMSLGAIAGATGIVKAVLVVNMTSTDITYDRVDLTIWTLTEPAATIMAASIPVLRMLYKKLKSSHGSYFRSRPNATPNNNTNHANVQSDNKSRRTTRYGGSNSHYGRNSVMIMSTSGWQESQEALQEVGMARTEVSSDISGIVKTEEVSVEHHRLSKASGEDSFELKPMDSAYMVNGRREDTI